jgi:hypothetical protein
MLTWCTAEVVIEVVRSRPPYPDFATREGSWQPNAKDDEMLPLLPRPSLRSGKLKGGTALSSYNRNYSPSHLHKFEWTVTLEVTHCSNREDVHYLNLYIIIVFNPALQRRI